MGLGVWESLQHELAQFVQARSEPGDGGITLRLDYLLATALKK